VDPSSVEARPLLRLAESFLVHQAPLHIGLVFAVNSDPEVSGREDAGVALLEAYNFAAEMGNPQQGLSLITDVSEKP
jgi:UDP-glucose:glycoprotein glucosyltransferase